MYKSNQKNTMKLTLTLFITLLFAPVALRAADTKPTKPNIIVILADDMGYADIGAHGCKDIPTPNIDALARSGMRFTQGYAACCVCSPSRASSTSPGAPSTCSGSGVLAASETK